MSMSSLLQLALNASFGLTLRCCKSNQHRAWRCHRQLEVLKPRSSCRLASDAKLEAIPTSHT